MIKSVLTILLFSLALHSTATQISGRVTDNSGVALYGVNIYIKGTYSGATTDAEGLFSFNTTEEGTQILLASFVGYKTHEVEVDLSTAIKIDIILSEEVNRLYGVTISAGSFEASDEKKSVVLKPLDIAMTAGATADIAGALSKLPGTTTNGESGKLFVRGGTANETQAYIDGVLVHNFYNASPNNVPSRSRFSPFLFKGTFFSTGGYSAEYGQALSSILSLTSNDMPTETRSDISLMTVGADVSHTQKWDNGSIYGQVQYTNLNPYNNLINQEFNWKDGFTSTNGTFMLRQKVKKSGMIKMYANFDKSGFALTMPSINKVDGNQIDTKNNNGYVNTNYRWPIRKSSTGYVGVSYGSTKEDLSFDDLNILQDQKSGHAKAYITTDISNLSVKTGAELISTTQEEDATFFDGSKNVANYSNHLLAGFSEVEYYVTNSLTIRGGLRYAHYSIFNKNALSPRLSMALRTGAYSQVSAAYGKFHQLPTDDLLIRSQSMSFEKADHFMINYQSSNKGRTFRSEVYFKDYDQLVKFDPSDQFNFAKYNNAGSGYAKGLDIFWRDTKTLKSVDYWISYSYIDTKRDFRDYPYRVNPTFAAKHNASVVFKHFISSIKTQIGASYSFNSGRPYNNPNEEEFNDSKTKFYSDLSFNAAFLFRPNVILYTSATNLLGRDNVFGYEFEKDAGQDNYFNSRAIGQPAKRFLFIGLFITLTKDRNANNLENLQ